MKMMKYDLRKTAALILSFVMIMSMVTSASAAGVNETKGDYHKGDIVTATVSFGNIKINDEAARLGAFNYDFSYDDTVLSFSGEDHNKEYADGSYYLLTTQNEPGILRTGLISASGINNDVSGTYTAVYSCQFEVIEDTNDIQLKGNCTSITAVSMDKSKTKRLIAPNIDSVDIYTSLTVGVTETDKPVDTDNGEVSTDISVISTDTATDTVTDISSDTATDSVFETDNPTDSGASVHHSSDTDTVGDTPTDTDIVTDIETDTGYAVDTEEAATDLPTDKDVDTDNPTDSGAAADTEATTDKEVTTDIAADTDTSTDKATDKEVTTDTAADTDTVKDTDTKADADSDKATADTPSTDTDSEKEKVINDIGYKETGNGNVIIVNIYVDVKEFIVPDTIDGKAVVKIEEEAFKDNKVIESVIIPDSVTEIGKDAFAGCEKLSEIVIGENVTKIEVSAFTSTPGLVMYGVRGSYAETFAAENNIVFVNKNNKIGDINEDGEIDSGDALAVLRKSVGLRDMTKAEEIYSDVNTDDTIDSSDALSVLRFSVGLSSNENVGKKVKE